MVVKNVIKQSIDFQSIDCFLAKQNGGLLFVNALLMFVSPSMNSQKVSYFFLVCSTKSFR